MTAEDVAAMLRVPTSWVYSAARRGELPNVKLGHYRRFSEEAVRAWISEREKASK
jgi:excisionase family DNA binding protein